MADGHRNCSVHEECSSTNLVHEEEHDRGKDDEKCILHTRRDEIDVAWKTSHGKDVYDVIPGYVSLWLFTPGNRISYVITLAPDNCCHAWQENPAVWQLEIILELRTWVPTKSSSPHAVRDESSPTLRSCTLGSKYSNNFFIFGNDIWTLQISISLDVSENKYRFLCSVDLCQPAGRFGQER